MIKNFKDKEAEKEEFMSGLGMILFPIIGVIGLITKEEVIKSTALLILVITFLRVISYSLYCRYSKNNED